MKELKLNLYLKSKFSLLMAIYRAQGSSSPRYMSRISLEGPG